MSLLGVIFDLDGTLVDSNEAHTLTWVESLAEFGYAVTQEQVRPLIGMGGDKLLPVLIGVAEDSDTGRPIVRRRAARMGHFMPQMRLFPGVVELLKTLRGRGLRLAVASSGSREDVTGLLERTGISGWFDAVVSREQAEGTKPEPDLVESGRAALGLTAGQVVMIGDTCYDIEAARRASVTVIALRCGGAEEATLAGAAEVYDDPAELLARLAGSSVFAG